MINEQSIETFLIDDLNDGFWYAMVCILNNRMVIEKINEGAENDGILF